MTDTTDWKAEAERLRADRDTWKAAYDAWQPAGEYAQGLSNTGVLPARMLGMHCGDALVAFVEQLRADVARLSPTDDEIRYTADQDWAGLSGATAWHLAERHGEGWSGIGAMMEAWRDAEVRRITAGLTAERDAALAELERAREVLRGVEWCELPHAYYGVAVRCPHCGGLRSDGHDPECPLSAALAVKGE